MDILGLRLGADSEAMAALTEKVRAPMARKVLEAVVPVTRSITLVAE